MDLVLSSPRSSGIVLSEDLIIQVIKCSGLNSLYERVSFKECIKTESASLRLPELTMIQFWVDSLILCVHTRNAHYSPIASCSRVGPADKELSQGEKTWL